MTDDQQTPPWPLPKFHFRVSFGDLGTTIFTEVSGLESEIRTSEGPSGGSPNFGALSLPSVSDRQDITLKRGLLEYGNALYRYLTEAGTNTARPLTVTVELLDDSGKTLASWALTNAFPTKFSFVGLDAQSNELTIEEIALACGSIEKVG